MALYFCAGTLRDPAQFRHYALNVPLYTHFTSPIRRFADVMVHRLLAAALGKGGQRRPGPSSGPHTPEWLPGGQRPQGHDCGAVPQQGSLDPERSRGEHERWVGWGAGGVGAAGGLIKALRKGRGSRALTVANPPFSAQPQRPQGGLRFPRASQAAPGLAQGRHAALLLAVANRTAQAPVDPNHALCPGYREPPDMEPDVLQKRADHCNDRRMASKRVQELSTGLFFAILVKVRPPAWRPLSPLGYLLTGRPPGAQGPSVAGVGPGGTAPSTVQPWLESVLPRRRAAPWSRKPWCWAS